MHARPARALPAPCPWGPCEQPGLARSWQGKRRGGAHEETQGRPHASPRMLRCLGGGAGLPLRLAEPQGRLRASSAPTSPPVASTPTFPSTAPRLRFPARYPLRCPFLSASRRPWSSVFEPEQETSFIFSEWSGPPAPIGITHAAMDWDLGHAERVSTGRPCGRLPPDPAA